MKRFEFSLERVLRLRETEERQARMELAIGLRRVREVEEEIARLRRDAFDGRRRMDESLSAPERLAHAESHLQWIDNEVLRQSERLRQARDEVQGLEARFFEKRRDRRMLERLRERRLDDWRREASAKEGALYEGFLQFLQREARDEETER